MGSRLHLNLCVTNYRRSPAGGPSLSRRHAISTIGYASNGLERPILPSSVSLKKNSEIAADELQHSLRRHRSRGTDRGSDPLLPPGYSGPTGGNQARSCRTSRRLIRHAILERETRQFGRVCEPPSDLAS